MKRSILLWMGAVLSALALTGCTTLSGDVPDEAAPAPVPEKRAGEELVKAFVGNDAKAFLAMLPDVVREEFGTAGFKKTMTSMKEQLGTPVSYEFVFNLEHPKFVVSIWKIRFERDNSDHTKKIHQEALFRAISGEVDGKEKLLGFNFF